MSQTIWTRETAGKAPLLPFQNLRMQDFVLHKDIYRIRDFLDCFLVSLPDFRPILSPFGAFASGPKKLVKRALMPIGPPVGRIQSAQSC